MSSWQQFAAGALLLGGSLLAPSLPVVGSRAEADTAAAPGGAAVALASSALGDGWASALAQVQPLRACRVPANARALPEASSELRLARDANGDFWQIQSGCRHRVVPLAMDPAVLSTVPLTDDVNFVTFALPAPVPTAAPLSEPAYAQVPLPLRPAPTTVPPPSPRPDPGYLGGYSDRVLVFDPVQPDVLYLLEGGTRHRVVTYYPYCVVYPRGLPICQSGPDEGVGSIELPRGGDASVAPPFPYLLRRRVDVDCSELFPGVPVPRPLTCTDLYEQMLLQVYRGLGRTEDEARARARTLALESAPFVANIDEVPLGEPAPNYGWGRGEVVIMSAQSTTEAQPCTTGARVPGSGQAEPCTARFNEAPRVSPEQYTKDPSAYEGSDIRLQGVACQVRYDRQSNRTTLTIGVNQSSVPAVAFGNRVRRDPHFADDNYLEIGASVTPVGAGGAAAGQLVIFQYQYIQPGTCRTGTGQ